MTIQPLNISYPDFVLNTVIDPEQFDTNNAELVNKINELLTVLHSINGAKEIIADAIPGFIGSVDLQAMLVALKAKIDSNDEWITADVIEKHDGVLSAINTISGNIDSLSFAKADKATTYLRTQLYTKTEADTILTTHKTSADHDGRYYTEAEINTLNTNHRASTSVDHDNRYYTEAEIDAKVASLTTSDTTNANNITTHKASTDHDGRYYTRTETNTINTNHKASTSVDHDNRYYTETELSATDGIKGSALIGTPTITGIAGTTVKDQLASLKENINQVAIAGIPDGSVTAIKMANDMKKDITGGIVSYNAYNSEINIPTYTEPITTNQEVNQINVDSNKVVNVDIQGKTVVNLLGKDGDCEDTNIFLQYQATRALDTTNKVFGNNGLKVTLSTGYTTGSVNPGIRDILDINKYYCVSVYVKNGNATEASLKVDNGYSGLVNIINTTDTTKFNRLFMKLNPTQHSNTIRIILQVSGIEGQYAYYDGIMLEEITEAQYNDVNFQPSEYVNSDMSVGEVSTRVKTVGKNLFNGEVELGTIDANGYKYPGEACVRSINYINIKENTSYILSNDMAYTTLVFFYNEAKSRISDASLLSFTTPVGCKYIMFRTSTGANQNNINVKFQLEEGTTATPYEQYKETYLDVPILRSLPSGAKDEIVDNELIKRVEKVVLDGSFGWLFGASVTGAKRVYLPNDTMPNSISLGDGQLIKYNNKIVNNTKTDGAIGDTFYLASNSIRLYVPSADSGWGDSYTPTADEIKAYFYGYKMYEAVSAGNSSRVGDYNGTGVKCWAKIYCGIGTATAYGTIASTGVFICPTTINDQGYIPYRLYYQLATPVTTNIIKPNLVAYPNGTLNIEADNNVWVIPNVTYTVCDSEKANIDEVIDNLSDLNVKVIEIEINYAIASGTNTYTTTIAETALVEGRSYKIKFTNANTGASTLNVNSLGAKAIQKGNGNALSNGNIKAGQICHLVYTGTVFQLLGEGGEYGTATADKVLVGNTIGTENGLINGAMVDYNGQTVEHVGNKIKNIVVHPSASDHGKITVQSAMNGRVTTDTMIDVNVQNLIVGNIKAGVKVGYSALEGASITGTFTSDANALANDIISGKTAYVNGTKITGTLANGKKFASGSKLASTSAFIITGLDFTPYNVQVWYDNGGTIKYACTIGALSRGFNGTPFNEGGQEATFPTRTFNNSGALKIVNTTYYYTVYGEFGITIPATDNTYNWVAYEQ